jgi:hypothetical protein
MQPMAVPILPGKLDEWRAMMAELNGPRKADFAASNARHQLTGHHAWLQTNPDGSHIVIAVHDGPGAAGYFGAMVSSGEPFDNWLRDRLIDVHGLDLNAPPPPAPEQAL